MSTQITEAPITNTDVSFDSVAPRSGERREFVNMYGTGERNYMFLVDDTTGQVTQVVIDEYGNYSSQVNFTEQISYEPSGTGLVSLPAMQNSAGQVVPFNDYFIGTDGYLYGNVGDPGADPNTIGDKNSTWVKLNKVEGNAVILPVGVPFYDTRDDQGGSVIAIRQDHSDPPQELVQLTNKTFNPTPGNVTLVLGDFSLVDENGSTNFYQLLPLDESREPFDEYHFIEVDGVLRLYVFDKVTDQDGNVTTNIYDMGTGYKNYGGFGEFKDGDVFKPVEVASTNPGDAVDPFKPTMADNKKHDGKKKWDWSTEVKILDSSNTHADTGKFKDTVWITEVGVDANGDPLVYTARMGKGKDTARIAGDANEWVVERGSFIGPDGLTYNHKLVHKETQTTAFLDTDKIVFEGWD